MVSFSLRARIPCSVLWAGRTRPHSSIQSSLSCSFFPGLVDLFFLGFEDTPPATLRQGVQAGQGFRQAQGLVFVEAEALCDDGGP